MLNGRNTGQLKESGFLIDTAGTYKTWRWVQPPEWSDDEPFDPKAGRVLLNVPFEKNKAASRIGARWSDLLDSWWIPEDQELIQKAHKLGFFAPTPERVYFKIPFNEKDIANTAR